MERDGALQANRVQAKRIMPLTNIGLFDIGRATTCKRQSGRFGEMVTAMKMIAVSKWLAMRFAHSFLPWGSLRSQGWCLAGDR